MGPRPPDLAIHGLLDPSQLTPHTSLVAVTQQLARTTDAMLELCRADIGPLDDLCSFRALEASDYLDLDWAPDLLEGAARAANIPDDLLTALSLATCGEIEVNPHYRDTADSVWGHPVAFLPKTRVAEVATALQTLAQVDFLTEEGVDRALATCPPTSRPTDPHSYLSAHFRALREFYAEAAKRDLCTIMWWD